MTRQVFFLEQTREKLHRWILHTRKDEIKMTTKLSIALLENAAPSFHLLLSSYWIKVRMGRLVPSWAIFYQNRLIIRLYWNQSVVQQYANVVLYQTYPWAVQPYFSRPGPQKPKRNNKYLKLVLFKKINIVSCSRFF